MNKILNYFFDQFVFWNLKKISFGYLHLIDSKGKQYFFGDNKSLLKAKIRINDPSFCYKILRKGSSGLAYPIKFHTAYAKYLQVFSE